MDLMQSSVTQVNDGVSSLSADIDDVTQLLTQVNVKWQNLRSRVTATEHKFELITESYPTFTGTL